MNGTLTTVSRAVNRSALGLRRSRRACSTSSTAVLRRGLEPVSFRTELRAVGGEVHVQRELRKVQLHPQVVRVGRVSASCEMDT